ncbi:MAG: hypothetical protein Q4G10_06840 [Bacteroidia bacterium]|nr:hypothetical protein [Bacteroidia bacterium]
MRKILMAVAVMAAILWAVGCREQSPILFPAPGFGQVTVSLDGLKASVQCEVGCMEELFNYGFVLNDISGAKPQEIAVKPEGGRIKAELKGLAPSTDYSIRAFATNGINQVFSEEEHFSTGRKKEEEEEKLYVKIPDAAFKELILKSFDENHDDEISMEEAARIRSLNFCTDNIRSVEGIECFLNLENLVCDGSEPEIGVRSGKLTRIDLRNNTRLRYVEVDGNKLTEMLLPETNCDIEEIHCIFNELESLDVSGCPRLRLLWCWENKLTSLDLTNNHFLIDLSCAQNDFSNGLDVSANKLLRHLYCNNDRLQSIDVSNNTELIELGCWGNYISSIDVSQNTNLLKLECYDNLLSRIDVSANVGLQLLACNYNFIQAIDLSNNKELRELDCSGNLLSSIDVSMLKKLENLTVSDNDIRDPIDLSAFPELRIYGGNNLPIYRVPDFSHNPKLDNIHFCNQGGAFYIDKDFFRDWPDIKAFNISGYPGDTIDLSLNTKMESLWLHGMPDIKILDLSASPNLKDIYIYGDEKLEKVYVHKDVDISRLTIETDDKVHAVIEHKQ